MSSSLVDDLRVVAYGFSQGSTYPLVDVKFDTVGERHEEDIGGYLRLGSANKKPLVLSVENAKSGKALQLTWTHSEKVRVTDGTGTELTSGVTWTTGGTSWTKDLNVEGIAPCTTDPEYVVFFLVYTDFSVCYDIAKISVLDVEVEVEINNTPASTDDIVCRHSTSPPGRPTIPCRARVIGASGDLEVVLANAASGGQVRFADESDTTRTLTLPASSQATVAIWRQPGSWRWNPVMAPLAYAPAAMATIFICFLDLRSIWGL